MTITGSNFGDVESLVHVEGRPYAGACGDLNTTVCTNVVLVSELEITCTWPMAGVVGEGDFDMFVVIGSGEASRRLVYELSELELCDTGTVSQTGNKPCTNCTAGYYALHAGSSSCSKCGEGLYSSVPVKCVETKKSQSFHSLSAIDSLRFQSLSFS